MGRSLSVLAVVCALSCGGVEPPRRPQRADRGPAVGVPAAAIGSTQVAGAAAPVPVPPAPVVDAADFRARMPARDVGMPKPPPGRSATFTFAGTRRGWVASLPEGAQLIPSAAWHDGKVYVGGGFSSTSMYALDAETGQLRWNASAPDGGPTAAIVESGKVMFNTESCTIFCVDAATGRRLWSQFLGDPMMSQPAAADGLVFTAHIANGGAAGYRLTALRIADGRQQWQRILESDVLSAPVVVGASVYATTMAGVVYRFDAPSGRRVWRRSIGATSAPWVEGEKVFLSRRRPRGREQQVLLSAATGAVVGQGTTLSARYAVQRPDTYGVPAGWGYEGSRPVLAGGRAYYAMGTELRAKDLRTGEEVWRRDYPGTTATRGVTPPAVVGGTLVVGTRGGEVFGVDVDTGLTTFAWKIGEPIGFQPIVANGWVYVTTATGRVVGLEVGDRGWGGWHMWGGNPQHTGATQAVYRAPTQPTRPGQGELRAGVEGQEAPLPLRRTKVSAQVSGFVARVTVEQSFTNPHAEALEAVYLFPLPADAAVDSMEMRIGAHVVKGTIQRKAEARRIYRAAKNRGALASLLEQERPNLFRQAVANIPPGETVDVVLRYANVLPFEDGGYSFVFPLVAGLRPGEDGADESIERFRPADEVALSLDLDAGVRLEEVASSTHAIDVSRDGERRARIALDASERIPDRDFALRWKVAGDAPRAAVLSSSTDAEGGFFTLMLHPRAAAPQGEIAAREVVLLVDASSSMIGPSAAIARAVANETLAGLRETDAFRIVRFSDRAASMDAAALPATAANVARARDFLAGLDPGGGTEMARAIEAAFAPAPDPGRIRIVLLVTDGHVGDEDAVLRGISEKLAAARLFVLGVGASPNRYLLERAAEMGRGTVQVAGLADDPALAAKTFASRIDRPYLTDVAIDWGGLPVRDVYPRVIPDLYADRPVLVHGRYEGGGRGEVRLSGRIGGRAWSASVPAELREGARDHEALPKVWARARIQDLETASILRGSDEITEQITQTGLRFGLVTAWTSFVAVAAEVHEGEAAAQAARPADADPAAAPNRVGELMGDQIGEAAAFGGFGMASGTIGIGSLGIVGSGSGGGGGVGFGFGRGSGSVAGPMMLQERIDDDAPSPEVPTIHPRAAAADVQGSVSRETVSRTVAQRTNEVRVCYEMLLRRSASATGRVSVRFVIGADGRVTAAVVAESTLGDEETERCVAEAVRRWTFPAPEGGGVISVTYPFVFQPARPQD